MTIFKSNVFLIICLAISLLLRSAQGLRVRLYTRDVQLHDKAPGDDVIRRYADVTLAKCALYCSSTWPCGFFFYRAASKECVVCGLSNNLTVRDETGWNVFSVTREMQEPDYDVISECPMTSSTPADGCWAQPGGLLKYVSAGPSGVWGVSDAQLVYYRNGTYDAPLSSGTAWLRVTGATFRQLDVGKDKMVGVTGSNSSMERSYIQPGRPTGLVWSARGFNVSWLSAAPCSDSLWTVDTAGKVVQGVQNASGMQWRVVDAPFVAARLDAGLAGVWVLDDRGGLYVRLGTHGDPGTIGTEWRAFSGGPWTGNPTSVSCGKSAVVVIEGEGKVWARLGVTALTPGGLGWVRMSGRFKKVDVYETEAGLALWALDMAAFGQVVFYKYISK